MGGAEWLLWSAVKAVLPKRQYSDFYVFIASQRWIYLDYKTFALFTTNKLLTLQRKCEESLCCLPCPPSQMPAFSSAVATVIQ